MEAAPLPEGLLKLLYVVGALLVLPLVGAFLWGALGGTHQTYRLEGDDELGSMTPQWHVESVAEKPKQIRACFRKVGGSQWPRRKWRARVAGPHVRTAFDRA